MLFLPLKFKQFCAIIIRKGVEKIGENRKKSSRLCAGFACIKFNAIVSVSSDTPGVELVLEDNYSARFKGMDRVWGFASVISRTLCQNQIKAETIIKAVKDAKLTTPRQLALLIK